MRQRDQAGKNKYGTRLQPENGRDSLRDAYEEALDLAAYLRTAIYERDLGKVAPVRAEPSFPVMVGKNDREGRLDAAPAVIPWSMAERAYSVYSARYGKGQTLAQLANRGGFATSELDEFIPGWREELLEVSRLRAEVMRLTEVLASRSDV
jgi:hypothetical protein